MRRVGKPTDQHHQRTEPTPVGSEPARFLRNLTSLPDADFAATYSPAIAAVLARYGDLPDPGAARRSLLLALKASLKRRRAFILPRFTQAEDSWRIRECASYAVAVAILVEHACALLAPARADRPADLEVWPRILANPEITPDRAGSGPQCALFHAIVPVQGRRWIAREPLVQTLIANYFTATAPNELQEIVGPVVSTFAHNRETARPPANDVPRSSPKPAPNHPSTPPPRQRPGLFARMLARARVALASRAQPRAAADHSADRHDIVPGPHPPEHDHVSSPDAATRKSPPDATRFPKPKRPSGAAPPAPTPPPITATVPAPPPRTDSPTPNRPASKLSRHRRNGPRVADLLDHLPTATRPKAAAIPDSPPATPAHRLDIGDHGAATARISHAADYARNLAAENGSRPSPATTSFLLPGPAPGILGRPLDIDALFPASAGPERIDPSAIAAWVAFRQHLAEALGTGAQSANCQDSLVHLLDVGAFLVWPQAALSFAGENRIAPTAIKSAMRAARVLAVNRADRQEDRHAFPALTGDPDVTCHGLVTLPEYLWPDPSGRPADPSTFVRPPAIYGQRYRRPH